jgi:hypothetical protein
MNGYEKLVKEQPLKHGYKLVRTGKGSHEIWASEKRRISYCKSCLQIQTYCEQHYESGYLASFLKKSHKIVALKTNSVLS